MKFTLNPFYGKLSGGVRALSFAFIMCLITTSSFSQGPPPFPDSTLQGGPIAVPFDDYLHLILLGAGLVVAFVVLRKYKRKPSH